MRNFLTKSTIILLGVVLLLGGALPVFAQLVLSSSNDQAHTGPGTSTLTTNPSSTSGVSHAFDDAAQASAIESTKGPRGSISNQDFYDPGTNGEPPVNTANSIEDPDDNVALRGLGTMCSANILAYGLSAGALAGLNATDLGLVGATAGTVAPGTEATILGTGGTTGIGNVAALVEGGAGSVLDAGLTVAATAAKFAFGKAMYFTCAPIAIYWLAYTPASFLLSLAVRLFDFSISLSMDNGYLTMPFIQDMWTTIRDLSNMLFIFVLVYTGIRTMLGAEGDWKRSVFKVIIIALLLNFSLFFAQVAIDAGNTFGTWVYSSMGADPTGAGQTRNLHGAFVKSFKLGNFVPSDQGLNTNFWSGFGVVNSIFLFLLVAILNIVAAWVFLQIAFIFIGRLLAFWTLMILAPAAFVANTLPKFEGYFSEWLNTLVKQASLAPLFMIMLYIIMKIMGPVQQLMKSTPAADDMSLAGTIVMPLLGAITVLFALTKAKDFAVDWAGAFGEIGKKIGGTVMGLAGNTALGGAGFVGRRVVGGGADALLKTGALQKVASSQSKLLQYSGITSLAGGSVAAADKARTGSWDARNSSLMNNQYVKSGLKEARVDFGKAGGRGGYMQEEKDNIKEAKDKGKLLGVTDKEKGDKEQEIRVDVEKELQKAMSKNLESEEKLRDADKKLLEAREKTIEAEKSLLKKEKEVEELKEKNSREAPELARRLKEALDKGDQETMEEISGFLRVRHDDMMKGNQNLGELRGNFESARKKEAVFGVNKETLLKESTLTREKLEKLRSPKAVENRIKEWVNSENLRRQVIAAGATASRHFIVSRSSRIKFIRQAIKDKTSQEKDKETVDKAMEILAQQAEKKKREEEASQGTASSGDKGN
ncbi:MAG: hypothetical protein PHS95_00765 [Candidatus Pacebacteria bacterium]|nr:hypothetical protein [Candidatus Paceibacterota bacterium]